MTSKHKNRNLNEIILQIEVANKVAVPYSYVYVPIKIMVIPELIHRFLEPQTYNIILLILNIFFADLLYQIYL